jgi:hypothetical protein
MRKIYFSIVLALFIQCNSIEKTENKTRIINFNSTKILYTGRINFTDTASVIYWQGSSVKFNFKGTDVKILMQDEHGKNYYNIILDNDSIILFHPDSTKKWYTLVSNLESKKHSLEIFKRTEWTNGASYIYGFETGKNTKLLAPPKKPQKTIEFFGNSITCGYANEDTDTLADHPDSIYTNNYLSYAAITARHFNTNYYNTARSGIGITVSWFPMIMNEMYYRLNPTDSTSHWDFNKTQANLVVINLFQNDYAISLRPDYPEFKHRFGNEIPNSEFFIEKYKNFVLKIRKAYPDANIICALGPMSAVNDSLPWKGYVKTTVNQLNDDKIYTFFFTPINNDLHPKVKDHQKMADTLIQFIEEHELL